MSRQLARAALAAVAVISALCGCATPRDAAFFVTKSSTSIVDADTTPATLSLGYDRIEGYAGPRFTDGSVFPVASAIESRGSGINREIRQVFVAGKAALIATAGTAAEGRPQMEPRPEKPSLAATVETKTQPPATEDTSGKVMLFGTGTTIGVKLGFAEGTPIPNSFTLGYRRKEAAVIPVAQGLLETSALGSIGNQTETTAAAGAARSTTGFDVQQFFATGNAAENLAALGSIKSRFADTAEKAIGNVEMFRLEEAKQGRHALDTLVCANRIADAAVMDRVFNNAEDLQLFNKLSFMPRIRATNDAMARRQIYYDSLSVLEPAEPKVTQAMEYHRNLVCRLAR
jgi:hypothetical protein